ncbi:MAG TPA: hypothetical protein VHO06_12570 [Polyangia bacterium]|nr:hypothetical protein [Polyangia bacterium]
MSDYPAPPPRDAKRTIVGTIATGRDQIRVQLSTDDKGRPTVDVRVYYPRNGASDWRPSDRGLRLFVEHIPALRAALAKLSPTPEAREHCAP